MGRYGSDTEEGHADVGEPVRPEFPPTRLALAPAFPAALGDELGVQLLEVWGFLRSFPQARLTPARSCTPAGLEGPGAQLLKVWGFLRFLPLRHLHVSRSQQDSRSWACS